MKTEKELNSEILKITMRIKNVFPELSKYIAEMPFKISYAVENTINIKNLKDYYDSLNELLKKYSNNHVPAITKI